MTLSEEACTVIPLDLEGRTGWIRRRQNYSARSSGHGVGEHGL